MAGIDITPDAQGKVRDLYDLGDRLLLVATDRISAFDYILEDEIPHKGQVLTQLSKFWFNLLDGVVEHHLISTDVADVSWLCPTGQIHVVSFANGAPGHSWQNVSMGKTDIGRKSVIHAGKVLAAATIDLFNHPDTIAAAKAEFEKHTAEGFTSPIPADAVPVIPDLT